MPHAEYGCVMASVSSRELQENLRATLCPAKLAPVHVVAWAPGDESKFLYKPARKCLLGFPSYYEEASSYLLPIIQNLPKSVRTCPS